MSQADAASAFLQTSESPGIRGRGFPVKAGARVLVEAWRPFTSKERKSSIGSQQAALVNPPAPI